MFLNCKIYHIWMIRCKYIYKYNNLGDIKCSVRTHREYVKRRPVVLNDDIDGVWISLQNIGTRISVIWLLIFTKMMGFKFSHSTRRTVISTLLHDGIGLTSVVQINSYKMYTPEMIMPLQNKDMSNLYPSHTIVQLNSMRNDS